jgi:hypothetical protein
MFRKRLTLLKNLIVKNTINYEGEINLNGLIIPCYVLESGTRVLSGRAMQNALKMVDEAEDGKQNSGARLSRYLNQKTLKSFIYKDKEQGHFEPIICYKGDSKINGFEATVLADICDGFLEARKQIHLSPRQSIIADQCEILIRGFARVGIIALIDEATGYQYDREKDELQKILSSYISSELLPWQKRFPDEFYKEIFRLNRWDFTVSGIQKRPGVIGTWTKQLVYNLLPKGVVVELEKKTPKSAAGNKLARLHQSLTLDIGEPHLEKQLVSIITLMNVSNTWKDFIKLFGKKYGQTMMDLPEIRAKEKEESEKERAKKEVGGIQTNLFDRQLKAILQVPKDKGGK